MRPGESLAASVWGRRPSAAVRCPAVLASWRPGVLRSCGMADGRRRRQSVVRLPSACGGALALLRRPMRLALARCPGATDRTALEGFETRWNGDGRTAGVAQVASGGPPPREPDRDRTGNRTGNRRRSAVPIPHFPFPIPLFSRFPVPGSRFPTCHSHSPSPRFPEHPAPHSPCVTMGSGLASSSTLPDRHRGRSLGQPHSWDARSPHPQGPELGAESWVWGRRLDRARDRRGAGGGRGTLYPALHRLERQGLIEAEWGLSENNRHAKYYRLSKAGRRGLETGSSSWHHFVEAAGRALRATSPQTA